MGTVLSSTDAPLVRLPPAKILDFHKPIPASFTDGARWYAVYTNIKSEDRVQMSLDARGYRTFLPRLKRWVTHARVKRAVLRPLIPRYLFVETDPNLIGFDDIHRTDGVESILANNGVPSPMPAGLVAEFIQRYVDGEWDETMGEPLPAGARVRIMGGQYDDFFATLISIGGRGGAVAQLLESRTRIRLPLINMRPA